MQEARDYGHGMAQLEWYLELRIPSYQSNSHMNCDAMSQLARSPVMTTIMTPKKYHIRPIIREPRQLLRLPLLGRRPSKTFRNSSFRPRKKIGNFRAITIQTEHGTTLQLKFISSNPLYLFRLPYNFMLEESQLTVRMELCNGYNR